MKKLPLFILIGLLGSLFLLTLLYGGGFWPRAVASDIAPERLVEIAWPCRGHDPGHTGQSLYQGSQTDALKWSCQTGGQIYSSPAIGAGGTIYIGSYDNRIYALNPEDGGQKWSYKTDGCVYSSPAIGSDGTIYAGSLDDSVYALNSQDGSRKWSYQTGNRIFSSPAVGPDGKVYIGSLDSYVYALHSDGNLKWIFKTGDSVYSSPAIGADGIVYIGSYDYKVYAIDAQIGSLIWSYQTKDAVYSSPAIGADGTIYIGSLDGNVYALKSQDGTVKWSYQTGGAIYSSPAIGSDGVVYIGSLDGYVYALHGQDGSLKWKFETGAEVYSSPAISADDTVYIGSLDGMIYALRCQDAVLKWSFQTGSQGDSGTVRAPVTGIISSPAIGVDGTVYITNSDGKIYAFNSAKPGISQGATAMDGQQSQSGTPLPSQSGTPLPLDLKAPQISCPDDMTVSATGVKTIVKFTATAADDVDLKPVIAYSLKPGSEFSLGTALVNVTATDSSGKFSTCFFQVTVKDSDPPTIICPPQDSITVSATGPKTIVNFKVEAKDNVDSSPNVVYDHEPGSEFSLGTELVKVIATDSSKNSSSCSFRVTVKDDESPKITCPTASPSLSDAIIVLATGIKTPVPFTVTATDNVDPNPEIACDPAPGSGFPVGTTRVMVTATDFSKNSSVSYFLVTVTDTEPPKITCPAFPSGTITVPATGIKTNVSFSGTAAATAKDNVDPNPRITYNPESGSEFPLETTLVTVTATDSSGNRSDCTFLVIVKDQTPPQIICPADIILPVSVTGSKTIVDFAAKAIDNVDPNPRITYYPASGSEFSPGITEVRVTATDYSNNSSTSSFWVIISASASASASTSTSTSTSTSDTEPPQITCPALDVISATGRLTRVSYAATATDNVDPRPQITYDHAPNSGFYLGTTLVNVTATDFSGNHSTRSFLVTVKDIDPPKVLCPATVTATAKGSSKTRVNFYAQAIDNVDTVCQIVYDPPSGSEFPLGTTPVRVTATDSSGNSSYCTFQVVVTEGGNSSPKINSPLLPLGTMTVSATGSKTKVSYAVTATDDDDPHPVISYDHEPGSEFPLGTTSVTATATDSSGNSSTYTFFVTVQDTTAPEIVCTSEMTIPAISKLTKAIFSATAKDNVDSNPKITYNPAQGSEFPLGATSVSVTATDSSGNSSVCSFLVRIKDTTPPQILCPADMTIPPTGRLTRVNFSATANDNVDSNPQITYNPAPGSEFPLGTTSVTATATDSSGNSSFCSFKVTIKDVPLIKTLCPSDMTISATSKLTKVNFLATAIDNMDSNPQITYDPSPGSEFPLGTTSVTATATDSSGNSSVCSFKVTIKDTTPPQITCPSDMVVPATGLRTRVNFTVTAIDTVDPNPIISYDHAPGSEFPVGTTSVTVTATDSSGNSSTCFFYVTIRDIPPPQIICPADITIPATGKLTKVNFSATAYDNVDSNPQITYDHAPGSEFPAGTTSVKVTATDKEGNVSTCTFKVTVQDTTSPVVTLSLGGQASYDATYDGASAPDEQAPYYTAQSVLVYYTVYDSGDSDPQVKVELSNNNDKPVDIKSSSPIAVDLAVYAGKNVVTLTAIDAFGNMEKASVSFEVALKLAEDQVSIKPETLRLRPNTFTVSLSFPPPYDATTVYDVNADGAKHKTIVYNPTTRKAICDFKRSDINIVPLDQRFEVTGFFMYKDTACKFYGSDTIRKVRWPTKTSQPLGSGQSVRSGETTRDCQWPFCNRLESLLNH